MSDQTPGDVDRFLKTDGLDSEREKAIGQHIGYRYDVNLVPDYARLSPFLERYLAFMGWDDLNWLGAARQPAGPRHDRARAADPVPNVRAPPAPPAQQGLPEVLRPGGAGAKRGHSTLFWAIMYLT